MTFEKMEENLRRLRQAGKALVGEELNPASYGGGLSREEQRRQIEEDERRRRQNEWREWRKRKKRGA